MSLETTELGALVRRRRTQLGLSLRAAASRIGISPSYLLALEHGRNPTTGRAPIPSPPIVSALGSVLGIAPATLLAMAGAPAARSVHLLLYQGGTAERSPAAAARRCFGDRVGRWVELGPIGVSDSNGRLYEPGRALAMLAAALADTPGGRPGLIFGASSDTLRTVANPLDLLGSEATWEHDVAAVLGGEPPANVCVYREADIRGLADPLAAVMTLLRAHPRVAVQEADGGLTTGPAAIETILTAARPAGMDAEAWAQLAGAAAIGLHRDVAA